MGPQSRFRIRAPGVALCIGLQCVAHVGHVPPTMVAGTGYRRSGCPYRAANGRVLLDLLFACTRPRAHSRRASDLVGRATHSDSDIDGAALLRDTLSHAQEVSS